MTTGIDLLAVITCVSQIASPCVESWLNGCVVHLPSVLPTESPRDVV